MRRDTEHTWNSVVSNNASSLYAWGFDNKALLMAPYDNMGNMPQAIQRCAMALWIAVAATVGCANLGSPGSPHALLPTVPIPPKLEPQRPWVGHVPGVLNFGFVSTDVWRGAKPTAQGLRILAAMGVKTILDLQEDDEGNDVPAGVRYVHMPVSQWHADQVDIAAVLKAIAISPKPIFIHCHVGCDRTGLAVAAYRLSQGMSEVAAILELHQFHVNFWWQAPIEKRIHELKLRG